MAATSPGIYALDQSGSGGGAILHADFTLVNAAKPAIQNFRVELGTGINPKPIADNLVLGANSFLLNNADVLVTEPKRFA